MANRVKVSDMSSSAHIVDASSLKVRIAENVIGELSLSREDGTNCAVQNGYVGDVLNIKHKSS